MKNFIRPIENHLYRKTFSRRDNSEAFYAVYLNGKFYVAINEPYFVLVRSISTYNWAEVKYLDGTTFDNDYTLNSIVIEDMGEVQPLWKRLITFGHCGWIK